MVFLTEKKSLFACKMKMLPHQFDNYLIEASRLYKKYARAVFPLSAKKCEIFFGIFAHIFHKCKTAFNSGVFYLHKREATFNFGVCFLLEPHKLQKVSDLQRDDMFFWVRLPNHRKSQFAAQHNDLFFLFGDRYFVAPQSLN